MIKFHKIGTFDYNSLPFDEFFVARKSGWSKGRLPTSRVHRSRCAARPRDKCARVMVSWSIFVEKFLHDRIKSFTFAR